MSILQWLSEHRWLLCMNPKGWTEEDEADYQRWDRQHGDWRGVYPDVEDYSDETN